ncbi:MAG: RIP metalloprotease RseP [Pseudomonadota bacterium]|nr:RIP metalloprotease RseP [Pseudomonadota bacterium]
MTTLLAFFFTLAVLIVFHEFGHYWVARRAGVKVLRFSVGFGQVIASRTDRHGTEWALSAIPLGGYVKMLDEREGDVPADQLDQAFNRKSVAARAAIVAAGPLANFLLAILLFWGLFMGGVPILKPIVGEPTAGSPAQLAGVHTGETITRINGEPIASWQDLHWLSLKQVLRGNALQIETVDQRGYVAFRTLAAPEQTDELEQAPLKALGLVRYLPPLAPVLGQISPDGVAAKAGLRGGDRIRAIDGVAMATWEQVVETIRRAPGRSLRLSLEYNGQKRDVSLAPAAVRDGTLTIGRIGAGPRIDPELLASLHGTVHYGPLESMNRALARTWELSTFSLEMLGRMITGQASLKNLSGPLTIADYAGQSAESGVSSFVAFLALVSVSLGVLNLLPVPLLDGGHLLYYLAEFLTGRPVPEYVQEVGQKIGMGLLGLLMFFALYNDLSRLFFQ